MSLDADVRATFDADGAERFVVDAGFEVETGQTVTILGPSGSGKTLLLESVAGFHPHDGAVYHRGERVDGVPPERRAFGFVFQDYALFPHMTVAENVAFGQRYLDDPWYRRLPGQVAAADGGPVARLRAAVERERPGPDPQSLLADLGIADLADRYPPTLSGGEAQRVALARALAVDPEVLLLDEPLSSLDVPTRQSLRTDLREVLADVTAVYVTHDRTTARALSDRLVVMDDGRVVQTGTPEDVFERPASPMVARFTGANCLPRSTLPVDAAAPGDHLAVRPEAVVLDPPDPDVEGVVAAVTREDASSRVTVDVDGVSVEVFADDPPAPGTTVGLGVPRDRVHPC